VTLFRPEDLAALLGLPDGVATLGWLCLGWPDERPPAPGLERAGWSRRLPLSDVVLHDRWPTEDAGAPAAPPSHLRAPDRQAVVAARDQADRLLTPPGSLGVLDRAVDAVVAAGGGATSSGTFVLAAADHPVAGRRVSVYSPDVTCDVVRAALAGTSLGATAARTAGLGLHVVGAGVSGAPVPGATVVRLAHPRGDLVGRAAMTPDDARRLLDGGMVGRASISRRSACPRFG